MKKIKHIIAPLATAVAAAGIMLASPAGAVPAAPHSLRVCATFEAVNRPLEIKVCGGPIRMHGFWLCRWVPRLDRLTCPAKPVSAG
jgi:hypothetical protein